MMSQNWGDLLICIQKRSDKDNTNGSHADNIVTFRGYGQSASSDLTDTVPPVIAFHVCEYRYTISDPNHMVHLAKYG